MKILFYLLTFFSLVACSSSQKEQHQDTTSDYYTEKHRPQFHFSQEANWMNDPNGMVYLDGEYHLFYQYYPDSTVWGPMHWGHAISKDLVYWEHLPIALFPDSLGYIFSGSAVYDQTNSSGLGTQNEPPLIAIYTYHDPIGAAAEIATYQNQGIAYSIDKGRTWMKYDQNPVLKNPGIIDFRDPKVFWMETHKKWVMALAVKDHIRFYSSANLINWSLESEFGKSLGGHGGVWECPDLFMLDNKWVLFVSINPGGPNRGSATQYFVGDFDGKTFIPIDTMTRWLDYGRDNYAGVTWSNISETDGRKIFLGWMSNWDYGQAVPTENWRSAMTVPRSLTLKKTDNSYIVKSFPVDEINDLQINPIVIPKTEEKEVSLNSENYSTYDLNLKLNSMNEVGSFKIFLYNTLGDTLILEHKAADSKFYINRDQAGIHTFSQNFNGIQKAPSVKAKEMLIRLIVDVSSVELFINEGDLVMTSLVFPQTPLDHAKIVYGSKETVITEGKIYEMKRIWD